MDWWLRAQGYIAEYPPGKLRPERWTESAFASSSRPDSACHLSLTSAVLDPAVATQYSTDGVESTAGSMHSNKGSRRGRRAYGLPFIPSAPSSSSKAANPCDQCGRTFARASTLKRHIQAIHESTQRWVCAPIVRADGSLLCPTCLKDPILCPHGMMCCWEKPEPERTFYRKDSLKQHLSRVHGFGSEHTAEDRNTLTLL